MLYKKNQKELVFIALSFICISILSVLVTQVNQAKGELKQEKEGLEEDNAKLKKHLSNKDIEIDELSSGIEDLNNSLEEQDKKIEQLEKDKEELSEKNQKLNKNIEKKEDEIKELTHLSYEEPNNKDNDEEIIQNDSNDNSDSNSLSGKIKTMEATAYTAECNGCTGITRNGTDVSNSIQHPSGHKIVAVDPNIIPLGTVVQINGETYIADDTGGDIKGNRLDVLVGSKEEAKQFGRQEVEVKILN